jgi:NADH:ubiquinone reductase (H+-translocating)
MNKTKTVIVGAGFGGIEVAKRLKKANTDVILIDKMNHHLFQPLLYQVATATLSPNDIAVPIRQILAKQKNASFIMGEVTRIDKEKKEVLLNDGFRQHYDYLVLAPGAMHSYFGKDEWEPLAPGIKTIQDAIMIRDKILMAFELAERAENPEERHRFLRFAIVGGGPTGVELAGAIAEIANNSTLKNFRKISPEKAEIYLLEGTAQILPMFPESLAKKAQLALEKLGVTVRTNTLVTNVTPQGVAFGTEFLESATVIWAAGNAASPLLKTLDTPLDRQGRALVDADLSIPGHDHIFVIGDAANCTGKDGKPYPGLAPVAKQEGRLVAKIIKDQIPKEKRPSFSYTDKGSLATIGKGKAVGMIGPLKLSGFFAWSIWCFVHIMYLVDFRNRILVLLQWAFLYVSGKHKNDLIIGPYNSKKENSQ